jgi:hypothetical protein
MEKTNRRGHIGRTLAENVELQASFGMPAPETADREGVVSLSHVVVGEGFELGSAAVAGESDEGGAATGMSSPEPLTKWMHGPLSMAVAHGMEGV